MGPGAGLIVGIPLVVMAIALLAIWRRERLHGPTRSHAWRLFHRAVTALLVAFAAYMVLGALSLALTSNGV